MYYSTDRAKKMVLTPDIRFHCNGSSLHDHRPDNGDKPPHVHRDPLLHTSCNFVRRFPRNGSSPFPIPSVSVLKQYS